MNLDDFYKGMLDHLYDGVYFVDPDRKISYWNRGAQRITGYTADEMVGRYCFDNLLNHVSETGTALCHAGCPLAATVEDGVMREAIVYVQHQDGHRIPVMVRTIAMMENGECIGAVEVFTDDVERHALRQDLAREKRLAMEDSLTGLPNRRYAEAFLDAQLQEAVFLDQPFGVLILDLDHFKQVNDRYGHLVGDQVLQMAAHTMRDAVRSSDCVARWGGEEFLVMIPRADVRALVQVGEKLRIMVAASRLQLDDLDLSVTVSVGGTIYQPGDTAKSILLRADNMLMSAKATGRNRVRVT